MSQVVFFYCMHIFRGCRTTLLELKYCTLTEKHVDNIGAIRSRQLNDRRNNSQRNKMKRQTMIHQTLHRKLMNKHYGNLGAFGSSEIVSSSSSSSVIRDKP
jgi:hypothetical protein